LLDLLRLSALVIFTCLKEQQAENAQMQGISSKILEYRILFWPQPLPPVEKKMRKAAKILCGNKEPVTGTCRAWACAKFAK
jgi:hypothetical protein